MLTLDYDTFIKHTTYYNKGLKDAGYKAEIENNKVYDNVDINGGALKK